MAESHAPPNLDSQTLELIDRALEEDAAMRDYSTQWTIPEEKSAEATLWTRQSGVFCGGPLFSAVFQRLNSSIRTALIADEGGSVSSDEAVARIDGKARALLSGERVALNLIGRLSGIATLTAQFVRAVEGTQALICDTRKTTPLWRKWEKYAVRMGGGANHRFNLEEMILLKDNHLTLAGGASAAFRSAKQKNTGGLPIEVEVDDLVQLQDLLEEGVERVLLDNMTPEQLREAVKIVSGRAKLEASGGIRLETVREIAETGVDYISVGALTHSLRHFDFSLEISGI